MNLKALIFSFIIISSAGSLSYGAETKAADPAQESDQQISEFSLSGYGDKGKKSWDLSGKTADIFNDLVKLKEVVGNMYGKEEDIKLTAKQGDFNKADGKVHLEKDVVITTTSGTKLTTDSLDWDRKNQQVSTEAPLNIQRANMVTTATGAKGNPTLKKVVLEKEVKVDILPQEKNDPLGGGLKEKIAISCDGPLEIDYEKNVAVFNNNVKVDRPDSQIYSDRMDLYFIPGSSKEKNNLATPKAAMPAISGNSGFMNSSIDKIICKGNVRIVRGQNTSFSDEAVYDSKDKKIILTGRPKLELYSAEEMQNAFAGN